MSFVRFACLVPLLLLGCASEVVDHSGDPGIGGKADEGGSAAAPVVFVAVDRSTLVWADSNPSAIDGRPIGRPEGGNLERFRELHAMIQSALNESGAELSVWTVRYGAALDGEASAMFAETLDAAPFPVVLSGHPTPHAGIYGNDRLVGHTELVQDLQLVDGEPSAGAYGVPLHTYLERELEAPALSVAGYEAWLRNGRPDAPSHLPRFATQCLASDFGVEARREYVVTGPWEIAEYVPALEVSDGGATHISAADLLSGESEIPAGALVVVGYDFVGSNDNHVLLQGGPPIAGSWAFTWTLELLAREGMACLQAQESPAAP